MLKDRWKAVWEALLVVHLALTDHLALEEHLVEVSILPCYLSD